jgi:outer membrane receptor for ferrienterochelin and colicins
MISFSKVFYLFLPLILLFFHEQLPAQNRELSGRIACSETKEELAFANILNLTENTGFTADIDGNYYVNLESGKKYVFKIIYTGYQISEFKININRDTIIDFYLQKDHFLLNEIVVTGTRTPRLLADAPVITRLITSEEIKKNDAVSIKDILEVELPGIEFTSHGGNPNINLNGMGGSHVLFLIDGERIAGETRDNIDYNRLNVENIERVEIIKGAASALYGSNAIGGVVNIITKNANKPFQTNLSSRIGSNGDRRYGGNIGFKEEKINALTSFSFNSTERYELEDKGFQEYIYSDEVIIDSTLRRTFVDGTKNYNLDQNINYHPTEKMEISFNAGLYQRERMQSGANADKLHTMYDGLNIGGNMNYTFNEAQNLQVAYKYDIYNKYDYFVILDNKDKNYINKNQTLRAQYNQAFSDKNILSLGTEYFVDALQTYQFVEGQQFSANNYVVFAQHDYSFANNLNIVYGTRLDYHSAYGLNLTPRISAMYKIQKFTWRNAYARGFKSPNLKELYTDWDHRGMFRLVGSEDLVPEKSNNISTSLEYTRGKINTSIVAYYNAVYDQISTIWNAKQDSVFYRNIDKVKVYGADYNLGVKLPYGFGLRFSYAFINHIYEKDDINISATRPHTATFRLDYGYFIKNYRLNLALSGKFMGKISMQTYNSDRDAYYTVDYPNYSMWRFVVNQTFRENITLNIGCDNILNYTAPVHSFNTSLSPGRVFFVGLNMAVYELFK